MNDPLSIKKYIRTIKDFPIEGIKFRDITSLIETPIAFIKTCKEFKERAMKFNATLITSIESRGFIFAGPVACELSIPFVLARKPGKLPNETYKREFNLEYGSTSIEIQKNTKINVDDRVVIIDDLIATGGTAMACANILNEKFNVKKKNILILCVIGLPDLGGSEIIRAHGYNVETLADY
ncbi:MAG: adenine phosphoribosyltransferase [Woeseia sp.]|nr:adenine phosphoribosyltransferase [Woeseia sp.]|tara:strand:+ start:4090 stop:4632 length:543 start_codon:yes stop_codon:yes gene_type:complete